MSSKNFYGLTGDVTIDGGILNVANTNVSGNVTSTSLLVSNVATLGTTKTFVVTASGVYSIDGDPQASLELHEGQTYIFDITASNAGGHPFKISVIQEGGEYTSGVDDSVTNYIKFTVPFGAPTTLYYYCTQHSGMGGQINISPESELIVSGRIVASGNVEASKITASANVEVTGNVVASKFIGDGSLLTSVTAATTSGLQVVTDNSPTTTNTIEFTNPTTSLRASSNIVATGNVTADHFIGDGSQLSGIVTSVTFGDAVDTGNISSNTLLLTNAKEGLVATGNVVTQGKFIGDGSELTGIVTSVRLSDAVDTGNTTSNTVQFTNTSTSLTASGNVEVTGNVVAAYFVGDGSRLTGISGGSGTSDWTKNAVTNQLHYSAGSVGISNTNPVHDLSVGSNLYVNDDASDGVLMVTGNVHGTYFVGDGSRLINLPEGGGSTNWTTSGNPVNKIYYPQNPGTTSVSVGIMNAAPAHTLSVGSNLFIDDTGYNVLHVDGNITAESMFLGALGIRPSYPLDTVTDTGNVTPHTISFTNPTLGIITASNVEIGGALIVGKDTLGGSNLEVGEANLFVNTQLTRVGIATDRPAATLHVNGSLAVDGPLTFGTVDVAAQHGLEAITAVNNTTPLTVELQNADTSLVTTGNVEVGGNVITSKDLMVTGNVTTNSELIVAGNVFYTNLMSVSVKSNVVTEYTGPHDRPLRKYPEVALTSASQGGYVVDKSEESSNGDAYAAYRAFDGIIPNGTTTIGWRTDSGYNQDTGLADGGVTRFAGDSGEWVELQLPNSIKLSSIVLKVGNEGNSLALSQRRFPKVFVIYGYNGTSWDRIQEYTTSAIQSLTDVQTFHISNPTVYHNKFVLVVKQTYSVTGAASGVTNIGELEYYGHEEGSGSLDTTLKTVYNVPATTGTQLKVYYDGRETSSYPESGGTTVYDISPNTNNGTLNGGVGFDSTYKAFTFDGSSSQNITSGALGFTGDQPHTFSFWIKDNDMNHVDTYVMHIGRTTHIASQNSSIEFRSDRIRWASYANDIEYPLTGITSNTWYHIIGSYAGGGATPENKSLYINGKKFDDTGYNIFSGWEATAGDALSFQSDAFVTLGSSTAIGTTHFNGSIANFRLYSKALNADQVKELYDYQKDYFLGSKSQVTLYKGHLGVGVTEPSGQLELAGDERIQEYPPRSMTGYETLVEGHGVFCASASSELSGSFLSYHAFNDSEGWITKSHYNSTTGQNGVYTGSVSTNGVLGEWLEMKSPYGIKLSGFNLASYPDADSNRQPRNFILFGSNDGNIWNQMKSVNNLISGYTYYGIYHTVNSTEYYTYFRVVISAVQDATDGLATITRLKFFGTPGPTTLDKGSLTLGRSLDVPRVSRYDVDTETPRPEKLVVDFDTTVNSVRAGTRVVDISGKGNHGTFYSGAYYSAADKAFNFSGWSNDTPVGTEDWIQATATGTSGNFIHSVSMWVKSRIPDTSTSSRTAFHMGNADVANQEMQIQFNYSYNTVYLGTHGGWLTMSNMEDIIKQNQWHHIAYTYNGTNMLPANTKFYIDGKQMTMDGGSSSTLSFPSSTEDIFIGRFNSPTSPNWWNGQISNFKLYSVALEPSEVKKLYNLGRTGRSMVISDTAVGIGKAPGAQLDVRGTAIFNNVGIGNLNDAPHIPSKGLSIMLEDSSIDIGDESNIFDYPICIHNTYPQVNSVADGREIGLCFSLYDSSYPANIRSQTTPGAAITHERIGSWSSGDMHFRVKDLSTQGGSCVSRLRIDETGIVYMGSTQVESDDRLKTDEKYITNSLDVIKLLSPQLYGKKYSIESELPERYEAGLIAQEIWYNNPRLRHIVGLGRDATPSLTVPSGIEDIQNDPDYSSWGKKKSHVNYIQLIPYIIRAIQELDAELPRYKTKVKNVTTQNVHQFIGLIVSKDEDVCISSRVNDKSAYGIIHCATPLTHDNEILINHSGEGHIWVIDYENLEAGDLITTSNIHGYGVKQSDDIMRSYTVAKSTVSCKSADKYVSNKRIVQELSNVNYWVKTIYTPISFEEYSNLTDDIRCTISNTYYTNESGSTLTIDEYNTLDPQVQSQYTLINKTVYNKFRKDESPIKIKGYELEVRQELVNVLDEHGQIQWEDDPSGATEKAYQIRYLDADGNITDEANHVYKAAFVGCTYHCG